MADQEFSSPGAHMASQSSGRVVDAGPSNGTGPGESNVIYSPMAYDNINRGYQLHHDEVYGSSARERADRYNERYMSYNNDLFNSAKEYDMYMSNTAIQRQVEDLKKAGLNPILASRLGGATYHGVNAPYLSISPASALNSFLDYGATMYQTDTSARTQIETTKMQNDSREFLTLYEEANKLFMQGQLFEHENLVIELKKRADEFLENLRYSNNKKLQEDSYNLQLENDKAFDEYKHGNLFRGVNSLMGVLKSAAVIALAVGKFVDFGSHNPVGFVG